MILLCGVFDVVPSGIKKRSWPCRHDARVFLSPRSKNENQPLAGRPARENIKKVDVIVRCILHVQMLAQWSPGRVELFVGKNINYKAVSIYTSLRRTHKRVAVVICAILLQSQVLGPAKWKKRPSLCESNVRERTGKENETH